MFYVKDVIGDTLIISFYSFHFYRNEPLDAAINQYFKLGPQVTRGAASGFKHIVKFGKALFQNIEDINIISTISRGTSLTMVSSY